MKLLTVLLIIQLHTVDAGHKCVWIHGTVNCRNNPEKNLNVEIRVYDRDGRGFLSLIDPDDLMGVTFSNEDGSFQLDGCGDDHDWIPGIPNDPEPYMQILHYCNDEEGETMILPLERRFVPTTYEVGVIELDEKVSVKASKNTTEHDSFIDKLF
ncbi:hypothetical protein AB6A40_002908 [Gnathostoma spinigerum]|uniref:Uncharacterized protein n=1 Tax=Gnathostoma spinigerum TaxID=75299 RepID=A0ABD6E7Z1_9BILA